MTNSFIVGLAFGGAAALVGAVYYTHKKKADKYAEIKKEVEDTADEVVEEVKTFKEKVKNVVLKVSEKIVEYKEKFDAATVLVGLMTASVGFMGSVLSLRKGLKKEETPNNYYLLVPDKEYATKENMERFVTELKEDRRILS